MAAPTVTSLPPAPVRNTADPEEYIGVADTWAAALPTFGAEVQAAGEYANTKADAAATSAGTATTQAGTATTQAGIATTKAGEAAASAASAAGSAATSAGWKSTSTTSMALTSGSKTLTIEASKQFTAGTDIKVKRTSAPTTSYAYTTVSTYNSGTGELTFTLSSDLITGSGTYTDWTVELSGSRGATGSGDVNGPASATNNALAQYDGTTGKLLKNGPSLGTSANNVVQLDGTGKLPAVDGSQLTGIAAGLTLISTVTASASSTADVTGLDSTYDHYMIVADNVQSSSTSNEVVYAQLQIGGTWQTSSYNCQYNEQVSNNTTVTYSSTTSYVHIGSTFRLASDTAGSFVMNIPKPSTNPSTKTVSGEAMCMNSIGRTLMVKFFANWNDDKTAGAMTGVRFQSSGGTITGTFRLYGFKK